LPAGDRRNTGAGRPGPPSAAARERVGACRGGPVRHRAGRAHFHARHHANAVQGAGRSAHRRRRADHDPYRDRRTAIVEQRVRGPRLAAVPAVQRRRHDPAPVGRHGRPARRHRDRDSHHLPPPRHAAPPPAPTPPPPPAPPPATPPGPRPRPAVPTGRQPPPAPPPAPPGGPPGAPPAAQQPAPADAGPAARAQAEPADRRQPTPPPEP